MDLFTLYSTALCVPVYRESQGFCRSDSEDAFELDINLFYYMFNSLILTHFMIRRSCQGHPLMYGFNNKSIFCLFVINGGQTRAGIS